MAALPDILPDHRGFLHPDQMRLNGRNPRLVSRFDSSPLDERECVRELLLGADLRELIDTIAANGFINFEPLIVLRREDYYLVLEGNRRLATVKLFQHPDWAEELGVDLPEISKGVRRTFDRIEVQAIATEEDARQFIGFKHINGPHKWDSYAKGRFAADWFRKEKDKGVTLRDIANQLGDRHDTIQRLVQGIFVLEQAQREGVFEPEDRFDAESRPFFFSHLYTALTRTEYRHFLELPEKWRHSDPEPDPVPAGHLPNLAKVLQWIYGSQEDKIAPVVTSQNPHIRQLGEVLAHPVALHRLEAGKDLGEAYAEVDTPAKKFIEALVKALQSAERAQQTVYNLNKDEQEDPSILNIAERLAKVSHRILWQLRESPTQLNLFAKPPEE